MCNMNGMKNTLITGTVNHLLFILIFLLFEWMNKPECCTRVMDLVFWFSVFFVFPLISFMEMVVFPLSFTLMEVLLRWASEKEG